MNDVVRRIREGESLPEHFTVKRILQTLDVPLNDGSTSSRREYDVLLCDGRYWLTRAEKIAAPDTGDTA